MIFRRSAPHDVICTSRRRQATGCEESGRVKWVRSARDSRGPRRAPHHEL